MFIEGGGGGLRGIIIIECPKVGVGTVENYQTTINTDYSNR